MDERNKVILAVIIFVIVIAICLGLYVVFFRGKPEEAPVLPAVVEEPEPVLEAIEKNLPEPLQITLAESDEIIRGLAEKLSVHPLLKSWLNTDDLILKFAAAIDSIAQGGSPGGNIDFFTPEGNFKAVQKDVLYFLIDPESFERYTPVADVFSSLDAKATVGLFWQLRQVFQEAYRELGYPERNFQDTLIKAILELLKVPIIEGEILLEKKILNYVFVDPELENLNLARKHLFRMGPENIRKIQSKLREMALALGIPENQLPQ